MKKILPLVILVANSIVVAAQWTTSGTNIYNSNTGSVGIGTSSPLAKLDINQAGGGSGQNVGAKIWAGNNSSYFGNSQIQFSWGGGGSAYSHAIKTRHNSSGILSNAIDFYLWQPGDPVNGEGSLNVMSLNGGRVGIGTSSPNNLLSVQGNGSLGSTFQQVITTGSQILALGANSTAAEVQSQGGVPLYINYGGNNVIMNATGGNVGIGTTAPGSYKLAVEGKIGAREVNVTAASPWPDYVFEKNYKLPSLDEVRNYIDQNQHLPEVPSANEVEKNGVNLGEMNALLLKKIEELTLHIIKQEERARQQEDRIKILELKVKE